MENWIAAMLGIPNTENKIKCLTILIFIKNKLKTKKCESMIFMNSCPSSSTASSHSLELFLVLCKNIHFLWLQFSDLSDMILFNLHNHHWRTMMHTGSDYLSQNLKGSDVTNFCGERWHRSFIFLQLYWSQPSSFPWTENSMRTISFILFVVLLFKLIVENARTEMTKSLLLLNFICRRRPVHITSHTFYCHQM